MVVDGHCYAISPTTRTWCGAPLLTSTPLVKRSPDPDKKMANVEPLDKKISVRLTSAEKIQLAEDAQIAGLGLSELVRRRYFGRRIIANADTAILRELRRLGGILKQLNSESASADHQQIQETLKTLQVYMEVLCDRQESSK
jgi:hypothetical protein